MPWGPASTECPHCGATSELGASDVSPVVSMWPACCGEWFQADRRTGDVLASEKSEAVTYSPFGGVIPDEERRRNAGMYL